MAGGGFCCGAACGMHGDIRGGLRVRDELPWIKRPNLVCLGGGLSMTLGFKNQGYAQKSRKIRKQSSLRTFFEHLVYKKIWLILGENGVYPSFLRVWVSLRLQNNSKLGKSHEFECILGFFKSCLDLWFFQWFLD